MGASAVAKSGKLLSVGDVAKLLACQSWQIDRAFRKGLIAPAGVIGRNRVIREADVPAVREALVRLDYLPQAEE